jgi:steroid 5-alpha reductase family enzyme
MFFNILLALHSFLRWAIIVVLFINIFNSISNKNKPYSKLDRAWNLRLTIITHTTFLIGLIQYFFGDKGFALIKTFGMKEVMKTASLRFWVVEHFTGMLIAVVVITIASSVSKKTFSTDAAKHKKLMWLYIIAFIVIMASVPWPFRFNEIPWLRGI